MRRLALLVVALAGCTRGGPTSDLGAPQDGGPADLAVRCDDATPCGMGQRCHFGSCIPDHGACRVDDECQSDTWCSCAGGDGGCRCVPWGAPPRGEFDPACAPGFPPGEFLPLELRCASTIGRGQPTTPLVVDLDGDRRPEILFHDDTGLRAVRGGDCSTVFSRPIPQEDYAVADLDGDGLPEIVGCTSPFGEPIVFDHQGNFLATVPMQRLFYSYGAPAIADVDGQGPPEIVFSGEVLRYRKGSPDLTVVWKVKPLERNARGIGGISIVADLDGDQRPEVIAGATVYDGVSGADKTPQKLAALGGDGAFAAVADFNGDGKPDLALVNVVQGVEQVAVYDVAGDRFLLGPLLTMERGGGPPTVADFDGDGQPELAVATYDKLQVFDLECAGPNRPPKCPKAGDGILWERPIRDVSSGVLAAAAFDFDGDGAAEVVHRDQCWLRVHEGRSGRTVLVAAASSTTRIELPVIADVDGDGHAEIVVTSDDFLERDPMYRCPGTPDPETGTPWTGPTQGLLVFGDPYRRWMPARPVWNQHSYHGTNVADDLSVPPVEKWSWTATNTYRAQSSPGGRVPLPDFTAGRAGEIDVSSADCGASWTLRARLCNRGAVAAPSGVAGTFYRGDPREPMAQALCTSRTAADLAPGSCEVVSCEWRSPPAGAADLWFRAGDDGTAGRAPDECHAFNNLLHLPGATCTPVR